MTPQDVERIVKSQLADPDLTGPLGAEDVQAALVSPYLQSFILGDTYDQVVAPTKSVVSYWVVAVGQFYTLFYDPQVGDFGLADLVKDGVMPQTAGVRGDLVSTFRAM